MKITVTNLRGVQRKSIIVPEGISCLHGANGAGKSTMALAPYFVLTGKGLTPMNGSAYCEAEVEFNNGLVIYRRLENKKTVIKVNGTEITAKDLKAELQRQNLHIEVLEKLYSGETTLSNEDMLKAAGLSLSVDSVIQMAEIKAEEPFRSFFEEGEEISIPLLSSAEKHFSEIRKNAKKKVKELEIKISELPSGDNSDETAIEILNKQISKLNDEVNLINKKLFESNNAKKTLNAKELLKKRIESSRTIAETKETSATKLAETNEKKAELEKGISKLEKKLSILKEKIDEKRTLFNNKTKDFEIRKSQIADKNAIITKLESSSTCPLYSGVCCTTNMADAINSLKNEVAELEAKNAEAIEELDGIKEEGIDLNRENIETEKNLNASRKELSELQREIYSLEAELQKAINAEAEVIESEKELEQLESDTPSILSIEEVVDLEEKLSEKEMLIEDKKASIQEIYSSIRMAERRKLLEEELKATTNEVSSSDEIIKAIRKLPEIIFAKLCGTLEEVATRVFDELKPEWVPIFKPSGEVLVEMTDKDMTVSQEDLSSGEKILLNYCLKVVVATLIGMDTIIVDNTDSCDVENYNALIQAAQSSNLNTMLISPYSINGEIKSISI